MLSLGVDSPSGKSRYATEPSSKKNDHKVPFSFAVPITLGSLKAVGNTAAATGSTVVELLVMSPIIVWVVSAIVFRNQYSTPTRAAVKKSVVEVFIAGIQ